MLTSALTSTILQQQPYLGGGEGGSVLVTVGIVAAIIVGLFIFFWLIPVRLYIAALASGDRKSVV